MHIRKEFFRFVIPSMLAFALSGIYAIADGFFVGNAMGDDALAAVNIAYPLTAFLQAVGTGIGMGGAIEYAINAGNQNENRGRQYMGMAILLLGGFSILFTALFLFAGPQILGLFGASGEILEYSSEYLRFVSYGAVFQIAGTGLVPFIRNMGGAVTAMAAHGDRLYHEHCPGLPVRMGAALGDDGGCRRNGNRPGDDLSGLPCILCPQKARAFISV